MVRETYSMSALQASAICICASRAASTSPRGSRSAGLGNGPSGCAYSPKLGIAP